MYLAMRLVPTTSRTSDDAAAIARSLHDPEAFAEVFDRHYAFVHRYIARRAGRERADDLASQTFTVAFSHRGRYRDDLGTARPWLLGIATNLLRAAIAATSVWLHSSTDSVLRRRRHLRARPWLARVPLPKMTAASALLSLSCQLDQREALLLHVWGELSYAEIASATDAPIGTVRSRISRACAALRAELEPPAVAGQRRKHA